MTRLDWDTTVFYAINGLAGRSGVADWVMLAAGRVGTFLLPGALALGYWLWKKRREAVIEAGSLAVLVGLADLLGAQVKHLVERVRPCHVLEGVHQLAGCGGTFSFPSNHAVNTAAAAAFLQVLWPASGWITWPVVLMVGLSRVFVGAHYPGDVLGGWLIGAALGGGAALLLLRWRQADRLTRAGPTEVSGPPGGPPAPHAR